jgi:hypothetical protein
MSTVKNQLELLVSEETGTLEISGVYDLGKFAKSNGEKGNYIINLNASDTGKKTGITYRFGGNVLIKPEAGEMLLKSIYGTDRKAKIENGKASR